MAIAREYDNGQGITLDMTRAEAERLLQHIEIHPYSTIADSLLKVLKKKQPKFKVGGVCKIVRSNNQPWSIPEGQLVVIAGTPNNVEGLYHIGWDRGGKLYAAEDQLEFVR